VANIRLLDPSIVSDTYTQLQQVRGFYDFTQKLDIDRYDLNGKLQDYVVGVRELDYSKVPSQNNNWQIDHTIYTHGFGFVGAPANQTVCLGQPYFISGFFDAQNGSSSQAAQQGCQSATDLIEVDQPRIYFGEGMGSYVVGRQGSGGQRLRVRPPDRPERPGAGQQPQPDPIGYAQRHPEPHRLAEPDRIAQSVRLNRPQRPQLQRPTGGPVRHLQRQRWRLGRVVLAAAALRLAVQAVQLPDLQRVQRELADPLRTRPARPGGEGGAVPAPGRRPVPGPW